MSKLLIALAVALFALLGGGSATNVIERTDTKELLSHWAEFKALYGRQYVSPEEEAARFDIFAANKRIIDKFNADESEEAGYLLGINRFADMTQEETRNFTRYIPDGSVSFQKTNRVGASSDDVFLAELLADETEPIPAEVDWRKEGRVSSVKNQGDCGCDWAFAAAGLLEGQEKIAKRLDQPVDLSVQQMLDCSNWMSCKSGVPELVLYYNVGRAGFMTDKDYPYGAKKADHCRLDKTKTFVGLKSYSRLPSNDEVALQKAVAKYGPVLVSLVSSVSFLSYKSGVYSDAKCASRIVNHAALVVGYKTGDPKEADHWIVKNSWGKDWGEDGYIRMLMNRGICSIALRPIVALLPSD